MGLYVIGSFFPALAARDRVKYQVFLYGSEAITNLNAIL
jgi:hypothetical protein